MKKLIRETFNLRSDLSIGFYVVDFIFRKILRQNSEVKWAIHHTSTLIEPHKIIRGKNVYPGDSPGNYIQAINGIEIGDYTNIGPNVGIISANHDLLDNTKHSNARPIVIGKNCWIGMNTIILPEVVLGDFTIIGANAVVTQSFPDGYSVIAGNPAKLIKKLKPEDCYNKNFHG